MEETRTEKISVNLTPSVLARLDDMRARRRWTRSTAAAVLIEHGLDSEDRMTALAGEATTSQEYPALTPEHLGAAEGTMTAHLRSGAGQAAKGDAHDPGPGRAAQRE
jgi:hypothetical protein